MEFKHKLFRRPLGQQRKFVINYVRVGSHISNTALIEFSAGVLVNTSVSRCSKYAIVNSYIVFSSVIYSMTLGSSCNEYWIARRTIFIYVKLTDRISSCFECDNTPSFSRLKIYDLMFLRILGVQNRYFRRYFRSS